jgi:hypothetical protein
MCCKPGENIMDKFVYVIFSKASGEKRVSLLSRLGIVEMGRQAALREGSSLEEFAGIEYFEDAEGNFHPTRELEGEELFDVAVDKLNSGGCVFLVFDIDGVGVGDFLGVAASYGLEQSARLLLEQN